MDQLGPNALGEVLEPARVTNCYLGLLLPPGPTDEPEAGTVLVVPRPRCCTLGFPSRPAAWSMRCSPAPEREPGELLFLADLTVELRVWPSDTWTTVGVDPQAAAAAVVAAWQRGDLLGLRLGGLTAEEP